MKEMKVELTFTEKILGTASGNPELHSEFIASKAPDAPSRAEEVAALGFDYYISGSDQIWNYNITGGTFNPVYFGKLPGGAKCIVYAGSAQDTPFPLDKELEFKAMLSEANCPVSIREHKLATYAGKLTGIQYPVVLDPTLLAGRAFIDKLPQCSKPREPYILIYQIDSNPATDVSVRNLEKRLAVRLIL